jgi:hypothetical protein
MSEFKGGWLICVDVSGKAKPGAGPKIHSRPADSAARAPAAQDSTGKQTDGKTQTGEE